MSRRVEFRDLRVLQSGGRDQRAHLRGAGRRQRDVGRGVVAVRDHGLEHAARLGRAGELEEDRARWRAHRVVDRDLRLLGEAPGFDLAQVLRQDEGLDRAADEQPRAWIVRDPPWRARMLRHHQGARRRRQPGKAIDCGLHARGIAGRRRGLDEGRRGAGRGGQCQYATTINGHWGPWLDEIIRQRGRDSTSRAASLPPRRGEATNPAPAPRRASADQRRD